MKMIFLGPPGAGKGTLASKLADKLKVPHISTGDLFREIVKGDSPLSLEVKRVMESGELVSDELTLKIVKERLKKSDADNGFIFDGFPRTIPQAEAFSEITELDSVINFDCQNDVLIKRLTGRRSCPKCGRIYHIHFIPPKKEEICDDDGTPLKSREDDKIESVENRLNVYTALTRPLVDWYQDRKLLVNIDASAKPDEIYSDLTRRLDLP